MRISIVGSSGSGKSTLGRELSETLALPFIELDDLFWGPNWVIQSDFETRVKERIAEPAWICAGNYGEVQPHVWKRATHILWLDYAFPLVARQLWRRTYINCTTGRTTVGGNRETWLKQLATKDSILLWLLRSHWWYRWMYRQKLVQNPPNGVTIARLQSPEATRQWVTNLEEEVS